MRSGVSVLREDNLLCLRKRVRVTPFGTVDDLPDLAREQVLNGSISFVADITYALSGLCLPGGGSGCLLTAGDCWPGSSWKTLYPSALACVEARQPNRLAHHSTGVQTFTDYTDCSGNTHPDQHEPDRSLRQCQAESFIKTLKYEESTGKYRDLAEARVLIGAFWKRPTTRSGFTRRWYRPPESLSLACQNPWQGRHQHEF